MQRADKEPTPFFSILIPSRNREELLQHALSSVFRQDFTDYEVIVSDNDSSPPYDRTHPLDKNGKLQVYRTEGPLSVTENWNRALEHARGEYIVMLGDDDALAPGALRRMAGQIAAFDRPDLLYVMAYHYCYPQVSPQHPNGYFSEIANSPLFTSSSAPFILSSDRARQLSEAAMSFRHDISFNAQHHIWKRSYIETSVAKPFFQSPYPDYFACFVTFASALRILVLPQPEMIIGISRRSFGFYYAQNRQDEGFEQFLGHAIDLESLANNNLDIFRALAMPGSRHMQNWLIAALSAEGVLGIPLGEAVNIKRFRLAQTFELVKGSKSAALAFAVLRSSSFLTGAEKKTLLWQLVLRGLGSSSGKFSQKHVQLLERNLDLYFPAQVRPIDIGDHKDIMDAYDFLEKHFAF